MSEAAVLVLANERNGTAVLDERYGRDVADTEAIPTRGTAYLIHHLVTQDAITPDDAPETTDEMLDVGWYCSPKMYIQIVNKPDEF